VLEGAFEVTLDGVPAQLRAGESIHVPRGVVHASANVGERAGRRVVIFSPAGMERFFAEAGAPAQDAPVDTRAALAAALRHGWEFVGR
jgi:quercetin dioxygenase-like cupin family protein